tara:strand:+ start:30 stop:389 length:360 start_codon:yes stop_codon:yes gene_type:complete
MFLHKFLISAVLITPIFGNEGQEVNYDIKIIRDYFSSENIGEYFQYPSELKDYSVSGLSIIEIDIDHSGQIKKIQIVKSLGEAFDIAILDGISKFKSQNIINNKISGGFKYRLPIYFKN